MDELWTGLAEHGALVLVLAAMTYKLWRRNLELSGEIKSLHEAQAQEIKRLHGETLSLLSKSSEELLAAFVSGQTKRPIALVRHPPTP